MDSSSFLHSPASFPLQIRKGQTLFLPGDKSTCLYSVRSGFFKSFLLDHQGREQVNGFSMAGDVLGLDGACCSHHCSGATALEASEVLAAPFADLASAARYDPLLQRRVHELYARQMVHNYSAMIVLGSMSALERLASFLVKLSARLGETDRRGFDLPMTRQEIGSFLGLTIETVSRLFSALAAEGLIEVSQKHVRIADPEGLRRLLVQKRRAIYPAPKGRASAKDPVPAARPGARVPAAAI